MSYPQPLPRRVDAHPPEGLTSLRYASLRHARANIFNTHNNTCTLYIGDITTQIAHGATATATLRAYAAVLLQRDSREAARWLARTMEALEPLLAVCNANRGMEYPC